MTSGLGKSVLPAILLAGSLSTGFGLAQEAEVFRFEGFDSHTGYLGIQMRDVRKDDLGAFSLPEERGVVVESVGEDSPAAAGGLEVGDVIVEYAGLPVLSARQFRRLVSDTPPGRTVQVTVVRAGGRLDLFIEVGERKGPSVFRGPEDEPFAFRLPDLGEATSPLRFRGFRVPGRRLGISGTSLTPQMAEFLNAGQETGVLVLEVHEGTPAHAAGLLAGDVIIEVGGKAVANPSDLTGALESGEVRLEVIRGGRRLTLTADLGGDEPGPRQGGIRM